MNNIKDLSKRVAKKNKLPYKTVHMIVESTFKEMAVIFIQDKEEIRIKNFGTFKFTTIPGKRTKHPTTKKPIVIGDKLSIRLGVSTKIKKGLNENEQATVES